MRPVVRNPELEGLSVSSEADLRVAYEDLLGRYLAPLRRLAWAYVRDGGDDLFQELAMALWTALPRFRGDSSERTWVYRIAHNTAISFVSRTRRRAQRKVVEDAPYEPASAASAEAHLIDSERIFQAPGGLVSRGSIGGHLAETFDAAA